MELIEVERLYAMALNIPMKEVNKVKMEVEKQVVKKDAQMWQWRLMVFMKKIVGVSENQIMQFCDTGSIYLHFKLQDFITSIEILKKKPLKERHTTDPIDQFLLPQQPHHNSRSVSPSLKEPSRQKIADEILVNRLRVHFLFTEEGG